MKMPGDKFRSLQKYWYKILEDSGFKDIEKLVNGCLVLKEIAPHSFWYMDSFECQMREEYYRTLVGKTQDENTVYRNDIDKKIMHMFADGIRIGAIVNTLKRDGTPRDRYSVRIIIRRYEMAWNIKTYTKKQLHKKV